MANQEPIPRPSTDYEQELAESVAKLRDGDELEVTLQRLRDAVDGLRGNGWKYRDIYNRARDINPHLGLGEWDSLMED
jgi:hypothetical protein